jgi:hypothetical protein
VVTVSQGTSSPTYQTLRRRVNEAKRNQAMTKMRKKSLLVMIMIAIEQCVIVWHAHLCLIGK